MPVLTRDQIKVWFQNLKKPPQEHFWTWLDSFWHKEDKIPQDAVENLVSSLQKKADLVNGVVPEEQLPFSVKTSEKIAIGTCVTTSNSVKLNVHSSGSNKVRLQGKIYTRDFPNNFSYTAVSDAAKTKILLLYALAEPGLFFLSEGLESTDELDPELPEGSLLIYRIKVQLSGQIIDAGGGPGFKYTSDDSFRTVTCGQQPLDIHLGTLFSGTINIESTVSNPRIKGISTKFNKGIWDGRMLVFKNNTGTDLPLLAETEEPWPGRTFLSFDKEYTLKKDQYGFVLIRMADKKLLLVSTGGGGAEFPAGDINQVLTKSPDGVKFQSLRTIRGKSMLGDGDVFAFHNVKAATVESIPIARFSDNTIVGFQKDRTVSVISQTNLVNGNVRITVPEGLVEKTIKLGAIVSAPSVYIAAGMRVVSKPWDNIVDLAPRDQISVIGVNSTGSAVTYFFAAELNPPFAIGSIINVSAMEPAVYNGDMTVIECTVNSVTVNSTVIDSVTLPGFINFSVKAGTGLIKIDNRISDLKVDDISIVDGDKILLKDQESAAYNGVYIVVFKGSTAAPYVIVRDVDSNTSEKIENSEVNVLEGSTNKNILFRTDFKKTDTLNVTPQYWSFSTMNVSSGYVPRSTGGKLVAGKLQDNGSSLGVAVKPPSESSPAPIYFETEGGKLMNIKNNGNLLPPAGMFRNGDVVHYKGRLWMRTNLNGETGGDRRDTWIMKLGGGLEADGVGRFSSPCNLNEWIPATPQNFSQYSGTANLIHTGSNYNNVISSNPKVVGADPRMYDGWLLSCGTQAHSSIAELFIDQKGQIFARGRGVYGLSDWKKALTDNNTTTTTLGSGTNYPCAKLAIDSTNKGMLIPRMTKLQRNAISAPVEGLIIYQTDAGNNGLRVYDGTSWRAYSFITD